MKPSIDQALLRAGVRTAPQYLTGLDLRVGHPSSPCLLVYPQGLDDAALAHSLTRLLRSYPVITGRMKADKQGHIYIDDSDAGMAFTVHRHATPLPPYGPGLAVGRDMARYFRQIYPWKVVDHPQALLAVEVHHFACGGSLMSVMGVHSLCDGGAFWAFMMDWMRTHHGHPITPPALDRQALIDTCEAHIDRPYTQGHVEHLRLRTRMGLMGRMVWQHLTQMDTVTWHVGTGQIAAWREAARQVCEEDVIPAAHDFVIGHALRHLSARLPHTPTRHIGQVQDLRLRRIPGIARKYMGNAVGHDLMALPRAELEHPCLTRVAQHCRMPLDRHSEADILAYLGLMARHRRTHSNQAVWVKGIVHSLHDGVMVNNCAHFPVYKMDFGGGAPSWFDFGRTPYRMLVLTPAPPSLGGGLVARLTARRAELAGYALTA
ncbi:MAG: acyltransferase [Aquabacterium sp.]